MDGLLFNDTLNAVNFDKISEYNNPIDPTLVQISCPTRVQIEN